MRDCATYHGVWALLLRRLRHLPGCADAAPESGRVPEALKEEMATEMVRKHELVRVLDALAESDVQALLLKGAALAYSIYPSPALRPRADTDLMIRHADRDTVARVLGELGYERPNAISGELLTYQCGYVRHDRLQIGHVLDVHWRISNTQVFSRALDFEEINAQSVPISGLGAHARAPAPAHSLVLACMHRAHHLHSPYRVDGQAGSTGDRLIWLYDIHLLVESMSTRERTDFARLAADKSMRAICKEGLLRARDCFGTRIPEEILVLLERAGYAEPSARHLRPGRMRHLLTEFQSLPHWMDRIKLASEHLFPPPAYMLEKYAVANRAWLPMLYFQRGIEGALKRIRNP